MKREPLIKVPFQGTSVCYEFWPSSAAEADAFIASLAFLKGSSEKVQFSETKLVKLKPASIARATFTHATLIASLLNWLQTVAHLLKHSLHWPFSQ